MTLELAKIAEHFNTEDWDWDLRLDRDKDHNDKLTLRLPKYNTNISINKSLSTSSLDKEAEELKKDLLESEVESINNSLSELYNKRSDKKKLIKQKLQEVKDELNVLAAMDYKSIKLEEVLKEKRDEKHIKKRVEKINKEIEKTYNNPENYNFNEFIEEAIGFTKTANFYGIGKTFFAETIRNLTYCMNIEIGRDKYRYNKVRFKVRYRIIASTDFIKTNSFKDVTKTFRVQDFDSEEEAKKKALEYVKGRKEHWKKKLFTEIQPPLPKGCINLAQIDLNSFETVTLEGYEVNEDLKI